MAKRWKNKPFNIHGGLSLAIKRGRLLFKEHIDNGLWLRMPVKKGDTYAHQLYGVGHVLRLVSEDNREFSDLTMPRFYSEDLTKLMEDPEDNQKYYLEIGYDNAVVQVPLECPHHITRIYEFGVGHGWTRGDYPYEDKRIEVFMGE